MKPKTKRIVIISLILLLAIASFFAVRAFLASQRQAGATYEDPNALTGRPIRRRPN